MIIYKIIGLIGFIFLVYNVCISCASDKQETKKTIFNDRNRFNDPDFNEDFYLVDTIYNVGLDYKENKSRVNDAELITAINKNNIFFILFSADSGFSQIYIEDMQQLGDVRRAFQSCRRWLRYEKYDLEKVFFESEDDLFQPGSFYIAGVRNEEDKNGECLINFIDYRDDFIEYTYNVYLSLRQTWQLLDDLRQARTDLYYDKKF